MFDSRKIVVATMHHKEQVLLPLFESEWNMLGVCTTDLNTDLFGTFTGEIERQHSPLETARQKCLRAMDLTNVDLAIASEGSFGPHPTLFFVPADEEWLVLIDKKNGYEWVHRELSTNTNYNSKLISEESELLDFARQALFPSHALILKGENSKLSFKGICNLEELVEKFKLILQKEGHVLVETDMRAMCNPTRMNVIQMAGQKLIQKLKNLCPSCTHPGFGVSRAVAGLPCEICGFPTASTLMFIESCSRCSLEKEMVHPHGKSFESAMYCDLCNP
jgi:hypothetical protein